MEWTFGSGKPVGMYLGVSGCLRAEGLETIPQHHVAGRFEVCRYIDFHRREIDPIDIWNRILIPS